jgi:hypothetical protein
MGVQQRNALSFLSPRVLQWRCSQSVLRSVVTLSVAPARYSLGDLEFSSLVCGYAIGLFFGYQYLSLRFLSCVPFIAIDCSNEFAGIVFKSLIKQVRIALSHEIYPVKLSALDATLCLQANR